MEPTLHKSFTLTERIKLRYRAEMFNFTNTPTFAHPTAANRNFTSRDLGLITRSTFGIRQPTA